MSNRVIHAIWDADDGRVALFLNPDPKFARYRTLYNVFFTDLANPGHHREFMGVFDAAKPVARDWASLPSWLLLPVVGAGVTSFAIDLVPKPRPAASSGQRASELTRGPHIEFDAGVAFDFRRRAALGGERYYAIYAETAGARAASADRRRHLTIRGQEIERGQLSEGEFAESLVEAVTAANPRQSVKRLLAFAIRDNRIGPARDLLGTARREVQVTTDLIEEPLPRLDDLYALAERHGADTSSIDTKAYRSIVVDAEAYEQPKITLRLGSSQQGAFRLKNRTTFLHIPTNIMSALRALDPKVRPAGDVPSDEDVKRAAWVERLLKASGVLDSRDPLDLLFDPRNGHVLYGGDMQMYEERRGSSSVYLLEHDFKNVSMGDIVAVFVHDRVRLEYPRHQTESGDDERTRSSFSSINFRFLINRLEPMDTARVIEEYDQEIALVIEGVKQRLLEREEAAGEPAEDPADVLGEESTGQIEIGRGAGLRLADLLWPAMEQQLLAEDRRRQRGKAGRLLEVYGPPQFRRLPQVGHALCAVETFGDRVKELGRKPADGETSFTGAAVHMIGGTERTRNWMRAAPAAAQQATIWAMFEVDPYFLDHCADHGVAIPEDYRADPEALRELYQLFADRRRLEQATRILVDFDRRDEARRLHAEAERLRAPTTGGPGPSLEDLDVIVGLLRLASELIREEVDRVGPILAACHLPSEPIDPASIPIGIGADPQRIWELRERAAGVLERKVAPADQTFVLGELNRLRSIGVLEQLVERLEIVDHKSEILRVVVGTADALTAWANAIADASLTEARHVSPPRFGETDWDAIRIALRGQDAVPDLVRVPNLADERHRATGLPFAAILGDCASRLNQLLAEARSDAQVRLGGAVTRAARELDDQFANLERFASVALATRTAQQLRAFADDLRARLARLPHNSGLDAQAVADAWNGLGRALSPDRAMMQLPDALRHAQTLIDLTGPHLPAGGAAALSLPVPPTYAEVRQTLLA